MSVVFTAVFPVPRGGLSTERVSGGLSVEGMKDGTQTLEAKAWLLRTRSHPVFFCLSFLVCKMGVITRLLYYFKEPTLIKKS